MWLGNWGGGGWEKKFGGDSNTICVKFWRKKESNKTERARTEDSVLHAPYKVSHQPQVSGDGIIDFAKTEATV